MQKLFFSIVLFVSFFCFSNFTFGQIEKMEKKFISYNSSIGDWDIIIPLPPSVIPNQNYEMYLCVNGGWCHPAEYTKKGIELIHPSDLFLWEGVDYYFKALFVDETGQVQQTEPLTMYAPDLEISLNWKVKNSDLDTEVSVLGTEGFTPNLVESYFSTIDDDFDSIIHGEYKKFPVSFRDEKFFGHKFLKAEEIATEKQYVTFSLRLDNDDGQERLYAHELSALLIEGHFKIIHNLTGRGAFTPFFEDNIPKEGYILSMNGQIIQKIVLQSDEPVWLEGFASGQYLLYVKDYKPQKIIKIN